MQKMYLRMNKYAYVVPYIQECGWSYFGYLGKWECAGRNDDDDDDDGDDNEIKRVIYAHISNLCKKSI
jgi:hypothetical protein